MIEAIQLDFEMLEHAAGAPKIQCKDDACHDVEATEETILGSLANQHTQILMPLGFKVNIPAGYKLCIVPRSGLAYKHGITIPNSPGQIDSKYKDEVKVILRIAEGFPSLHIKKGDRIAQIYLEKVQPMAVNIVETIDTTDDRGGGFGHTGR